ncbi:putative RDD family membrane protein YckC [Streptosporangium becharense]|uniref:Putative RDD family membrane protein YckC n=1 Tax=Streptosporangium becharense TaxID=1816182 RepID=A0A7W9IGB3_9ACTN|nr:RDD family protein [Streptosporangium becharense]MBB2914955.1 putative RDD family membrane protein YckC [Streptosporangium becharense]MBB5820234.1 putative RDD family membrane protein YckC [Streptosporangium becharense]
MQNVEAWAVPALLVLGGFLACLGRRNPRSTGRRTAGVLVLIAVIKPVTPLYASAEVCDGIPILSTEWFATVMSSWGSTQLCLLGAAALVLLVTRMMSDTTSKRPEVASSTGVTWRRPVALLVDYAIVVVVLTFVVQPILLLTGVDEFSPSIRLRYGLLNEAELSLDNADPERLPALFAVFLYFWVQHSLWGQTPGKRLLRIRLVSTRTTVRPTVGRTALRTLIFPILVFVPFYGPIVFIVDGVWALLDPEGRTLHDRWANTDVTRKVPNVQAGK